MSALSKEPRWERRKQDRPHELLAAALELFVERGYAATRLEDVATRAGVSKGTLYLYFDSKENLFKSVVRTNMLPLLDQAEARIAGHAGSSADLLRDLIMHWWEAASHSGVMGIAKLMMADLSYSDLRDADFTSADLSGCNLEGANLAGAKLWRAKFRKVDLSGDGSRLWPTSFAKARLNGADLRDASLAGVVLRGTDLTAIKTSFATLKGADLSAARGWQPFEAPA